MQFQFDPLNPTNLVQSGDPILPFAILIIVSLVGIWCVLSERKKAKGHWGDMRKWR